jgi:hypothetical protein
MGIVSASSGVNVGSLTESRGSQRFLDSVLVSGRAAGRNAPRAGPAGPEPWRSRPTDRTGRQRPADRSDRIRSGRTKIARSARVASGIRNVPLRGLLMFLSHTADSRIMPPGVPGVMRHPANRAGPTRPWDTRPFTGLGVMQGASRTAIIGRMERAGTWFVNRSLSWISYDR